MTNPLKAAVHSFGRSYVRRLLQSQAETQSFRRHNERAVEYRFLFECVSELRPRNVVDVGTGTTALPSLLATCGCVVTAIDNIKDYWPNGMINRHWHVVDEDIRCPKAIHGPFDLVSCISVIEHITDHEAAFQGLIKLLRVGGHLVVTTPFNERRSVPNVYDLTGAAYGHGAPYPCRSTSSTELKRWLASSGASIVRQEWWRLWSGDVWCQGEFLPSSPASRSRRSASTNMFASSR